MISDSVGLTAQAVARAAAAQFGVTNPVIEVLPKVRTFEEIKEFMDEHSAVHKRNTGDGRMLVFYTLVDRDLSRQLAEYAGGRNPQELHQADIVLLGVSRSSKTPTSIYLSQQGYKVANIPLDPSTAPPAELEQVDRTRLFGLMTTPEVLIGIRQRRLGRASAVASRYADPEYVYRDLEDARALMRKLGCIVIHTENRAVEETAQEILRYYERAHPPSADMIGSA